MHLNKKKAVKPSFVKTAPVNLPAASVLLCGRLVVRCVFRLLSGRSSFTPGKEYFKTRDRAYSESEKDEIFADGEYRKVVQLLVDEACGEACVFIEKNHAGRLRVYAQFRRLGDSTVGQFSSDMPNNTDIGNCYKAGEITFGKVFRDR